jgi:hypothetical protein
MYIYRSLLKHGYSNFGLEILEYCTSDKLIEKEKYYLKLLNPEYNIILDPTLPPMSNRKHSEETRNKLAVPHAGHFKKGGNRLEGAGIPSQKILVLDLNTNESTTYGSMHATSRALNITTSTISNYINRKQKKPYKGRYVFQVQIVD